MTNMSSTNDKLQVNFREALTLKKFEFSKTGLTPTPTIWPKLWKTILKNILWPQKVV